MMKCVLYVPNERSARRQLQAYKIQTHYIVLQMNISLKVLDLLQKTYHSVLVQLNNRKVQQSCRTKCTPVLESSQS